MEKITKDMNIGDAVKSNPETAKVFMEHGMHCIGCIASQFETIEQGAKAHGMSDEDIDKMIEKANKSAKSAQEGN